MRNGDGGWNPLYEEGFNDMIESIKREEPPKKCPQCGTTLYKGSTDCCLFSPGSSVNRSNKYQQ